MKAVKQSNGVAGQRLRDPRGFTLIELLIVMILLGLLAALVAPKMFQKVGSSKLKSAKMQIALFGTALDAFRLDVGRYPTREEGLEALRRNPGVQGWDGPYLPKEIPMDPWNRPYAYVSPGEHGDYDLYSFGGDGQAGGEGENSDVHSWD
ncbi:MAG TPA: type II secretion system protein GspG [Syntrophobacteraceae bacterium]|jgi:general secretion pathway protein G|nr:type II secretion system protein GspG [Syntrophobacteraceae bacterium]HBD10492.1 type II secretion system protein GspG [Syntrophobacteraceae bacterium]HBZ55611.1 type II secretion system protein GspG [Syntrophobacteraceae bacterium]